MELINRYIAEVGRQLPAKNRADLEQEIRSLLEDALEDRAGQAGRAPDEDMVVEVLKEFGPPAKMAASYQPERYLIGPKLFPAYLSVIKIALPIILVIAAIGFGMRVGQVEGTVERVVEVWIEAMAELVGSVVAVVGNITIIFALLEWLVPGLKVNLAEKDWDPRKLPRPAAQPEQVSLVGQSVEIAFTMIAIVIFNFFPQIIGIGYAEGQGWQTLPVLAEVFFSCYLIWLNIIWALQIVLNVILISRGRWDTLTSWLYMASKFMGVVLALVMLNGPSLIGITAEQMAAQTSMGEAAGTLVTLLKQVVVWALVLTIILSSLDLLKVLWKVVFKQMRPVALVKGE
jgi:hypothetical protein